MYNKEVLVKWKTHDLQGTHTLPSVSSKGDLERFVQDNFGCVGIRSVSPTEFIGFDEYDGEYVNLEVSMTLYAASRCADSDSVTFVPSIDGRMRGDVYHLVRIISGMEEHFAKVYEDLIDHTINLKALGMYTTAIYWMQCPWHDKDELGYAVLARTPRDAVYTLLTHLWEAEDLHTMKEAHISDFEEDVNIFPIAYIPDVGLEDTVIPITQDFHLFDEEKSRFDGRSTFVIKTPAGKHVVIYAKDTWEAHEKLEKWVDEEYPDASVADKREMVVNSLYLWDDLNNESIAGLIESLLNSNSQSPITLDISATPPPSVREAIHYLIGEDDGDGTKFCHEEITNFLDRHEGVTLKMSFDEAGVPYSPDAVVHDLKCMKTMITDHLGTRNYTIDGTHIYRGEVSFFTPDRSATLKIMGVPS